MFTTFFYSKHCKEVLGIFILKNTWTKKKKKIIAKASR